MGWKQTGHPTVQKQRDRWVVRVPGIDTETGQRRPRQIGSFNTKRTAQKAASAFTASGEAGSNHGTVGHLVDQWAAGRIDVSTKTRQQYQWAAGHINAGVGAIPVDRLDRDDVAEWLKELGKAGKLSRRSIQIIRMVLKAALDDAVASGELRRNPAGRVKMPRKIAKPPAEREAEVWTEDQLDQFLASAEGHRWEGPLRLAAFYGLRRSELLGLHWSAVDLKEGTVRIERALVEFSGGTEWSDGKNARSRRTISIDPVMVAALTKHRRFQAEERLVAGPAWVDNDLVVATRTGGEVRPTNFDQTLARLVAKAGVPKLTSHGLRHTAATHMVSDAVDLGELAAAADVLGHSPEMLMKTYTHVMPESLKTVTDKIARRAARKDS